MTLDAKLRPVAENLIAKFGKTISLTSVAAGSYDPATASVENVETSANVKAIVEDYKGRELGEGVISGDKKLTLAALGMPFVPKPGDKAGVDGVTYAVVSVKSVYSGELAATYELQGRAS